MERFLVSWELVTPQSAEIGDAEDRGFMAGTPFSAYRVNADTAGPGIQPECFTLGKAVAALSDDLPGLAGLEAMEPDSSDPATAGSVRAIWRLPNGDSESRTLHFPRNTTPASRVRLCRAILA